ncbi:hypothetical protein PBR71_11855 [Levilactobacillus brevis]|uniref:hypothetical protein n=1 Tax=Levilactobacillus brevis TaxID=1580 RepID=UPI0022DE4B62|nr:hypothetical protein [Levilactobacillus brevis]MDA0411380.1 hypothetical protein [Levilactobacillus brevis]
MSRATRKENESSNNNFAKQLSGDITAENLDSTSTPTASASATDKTPFAPKINIKNINNKVATVNQSFVIRQELKDILDELVFLPNSNKRRPGTKGLLSDLANDGVARELYRRNIIDKEQMNFLLRK